MNGVEEESAEAYTDVASSFGYNWNMQCKTFMIKIKGFTVNCKNREELLALCPNGFYLAHEKRFPYVCGSC